MSKHGRIRQTWISLLLVLVMTVQLLPVSVMAVETASDTGATGTSATVTDADTPATAVTAAAARTATAATAVATGTTVASGNCGPETDGANADNAAWVLTSDGTLTVSGSGKMEYNQAWIIDATPIKSVVIGEGITEINSAGGWRYMETLSLPASLTGFNAEIIRNCDALESITLAEGSATYKLVDGALLSKDGTVLHWYPANYPGNTYNVPSGVKTIGDYAVYGNENLNTVTLPDGLVTIGDHAFNSCYNLNCTLTIPATVKTMGEYCLCYITYLTVVIPANSVPETIGKGALEDNWTAELTLPATLRSVGARALPVGDMKGSNGAAILTFYSRTVTLAENAIYEGSTVYGYSGSTVETYANAINSNENEWDDINFISLDTADLDLSGRGKTIGFVPGIVDSSAPNYATEINGAAEECMGLVGEKAGISLVSGSVKDKKDAVLTKLTFTMQLHANLTGSEQAIPTPSFALSSAKEAATTLTVTETTTEEQLANGARWYTVTVENGSFSDGEIVLTCAYEPGIAGWYSTRLKDVKAVYAYADGSKTGSEVTPAKVASASYYTIESFSVGDGTTVELMPGGLNTATGAASLFGGGWKRGSLPTTVDGKTAIYQTAGQSATVSLKLTPGWAQNHYSKTTVKCYLSDSADGYASG